MQHLESNDVVSVIMDDTRRTTDSGIVLTETEAVLQSKDHRVGTVHAAPEFYTFQRGKKEIRTACPVKAGDRVMVDRFAGISTVKEGDLLITLVHVHEIHGIIDND